MLTSGGVGKQWEKLMLDVKPSHMVWDNYPPAISTSLSMAYTLSWTAGGDRQIEMEMGLFVG